MTSCAPVPDHNSSEQMLALAGPPIRAAMMVGFPQGRGHAAGDQAELVVGDAGGAVHREDQGKIDCVHGSD